MAVGQRCDTNENKEVRIIICANAEGDNVKVARRKLKLIAEWA